MLRVGTASFSFRRNSFKYINDICLSGWLWQSISNSKFRGIDARLWKNNARSNFCWKQFETDSAVHPLHFCHSL